MRVSQKAFIRDLLLKGETLTRVTAMHYGIMNVTARIAELRNDGFNVKCRWKMDAEGAEYGSWYIPRDEQRTVTHRASFAPSMAIPGHI